MVTRKLGFSFNLVSYNILSQTLLNDHSHLYSNCNPKDLEWPKRGMKILTELIKGRADIICLQEVDALHLQTLFKPRLAKYGYQCLYKKKTGIKSDGCAIFFKHSLFRLLQHKCIEFNQNDTASILNRDNVGIIAVLKPKYYTSSDSNKLVIANTHLIFNPRRIDIKLAQLKLFLTELEEFSLQNYDKSNDKCQHHPTILCGDMNSVPESDVNKFIVNGYLENDKFEADTSQKECQQSNVVGADGVEFLSPEANLNQKAVTDIRHSFQFKSVYPTRNGNGELYVSTFSSCLVDYIFYTEKVNLLSYRELLTEEELKSIGPIPNSKFPSDHLSLEADFMIK